MSENISQFRGTAFGGFHRQDVLDYLAAIDTEHRTQLSTYQEELAEANTARKEAENDLERERQDAAQAKEELQRLREERDALRDRLEESEEKRRVSQVNLNAAREELRKAQEQVAELEPAAIAYDRLKERAATIELDAHERAQMALDKARSDREALREETIRWVARVKSRYDSFRGDVEGILTHSTRELERIQEAFQQISTELGNHEDSLDALMTACQASVEVEEE